MQHSFFVFYFIISMFASACGEYFRENLITERAPLDGVLFVHSFQSIDNKEEAGFGWNSAAQLDDILKVLLVIKISEHR